MIGGVLTNFSSHCQPKRDTWRGIIGGGKIFSIYSDFIYYYYYYFDFYNWWIQTHMDNQNGPLINLDLTIKIEAKKHTKKHTLLDNLKCP